MKYIKGLFKLTAFFGSITAILHLARFLLGGENVIIAIVCLLIGSIVVTLAGAVGEE